MAHSEKVYRVIRDQVVNGPGIFELLAQLGDRARGLDTNVTFHVSRAGFPSPEVVRVQVYSLEHAGDENWVVRGEGNVPWGWENDRAVFEVSFNIQNRCGMMETLQPLVPH